MPLIAITIKSLFGLKSGSRNPTSTGKPRHAMNICNVSVLEKHICCTTVKGKNKIDISRVQCKHIYLLSYSNNTNHFYLSIYYRCLTAIYKKLQREHTERTTHIHTQKITIYYYYIQQAACVRISRDESGPANFNIAGMIPTRQRFSCNGTLSSIICYINQTQLLVSIWLSTLVYIIQQ